MKRQGARQINDALVAGVEPADNVEQRGLAAARTANQRDEITRSDLEVDAIEDVTIRVRIALVKTTDLNHPGSIAVRRGQRVLTQRRRGAARVLPAARGQEFAFSHHRAYHACRTRIPHENSRLRPRHPLWLPQPGTASGISPGTRPGNPFNSDSGHTSTRNPHTQVGRRIHNTAASLDRPGGPRSLLYSARRFKFVRILSTTA